MGKRKHTIPLDSSEAMYIIEAECWNCAKPMKVALIRGDFNKRGATTTGPESFTENEIELAKSKDVIIKESFSATMNEKYLANTCPNCNKFVGQFYLFTDYFSPAELGDYKFERIELA